MAAFVLAGGALAELACGGGSQGGVSCPPGDERCACYPNGTCNGTLECLSDCCVSTSGAGGGAGSVGAGGMSGGSGSVGTGSGGAQGGGRGGSDSAGSSGAGGGAGAGGSSTGGGSGAGGSGGQGGAGAGTGGRGGGSAGSGGSGGSARGGTGGSGGGSAGTGGSARGGSGGSGAGGGGGGTSSQLLSNVLAVEGGEGMTCALMMDRTVKCWGLGDLGQIGDGAFTNRPYPTTVAGLSNVRAISVSDIHSCAVLMNGTVACWGWNTYGQVGNGNTQDQPRPVTVPGLTGAVGVTGGLMHSCALIGDGTVRCWGDNYVGELGTAPSSPSLVPVAVPDVAGATSIAGGEFHTCALLTGGTVKCWGYNVFGQLGTGTAGEYTGPVPSLLTGVAEIATGTSFTCARTTSGTVRCWGVAGPSRPARAGGPEAAVGDRAREHRAGGYGRHPGVRALCHRHGLLLGRQHSGPARHRGDRFAVERRAGAGQRRHRRRQPRAREIPQLRSAHRLHCALLGPERFGALGDGTTTSSGVPVAVRLSGVGATPGSFSGPNLVPNGDFTNGQTGWQATGVSNADAFVMNDVFFFQYADGGTGTVGTTGPLALVGGARYEFSFRVWTTVDSGNTARVRAKVGEAAPPYGDYTTFSPIVTATPTTHSIVFSTPADVTAGVAFITSATWHGNTYIDDVVVRVSHQ